ncbi:MAG: hypothetical protein J6S67_06490 [Methanobrevibacter sp.]|nr:hypothetical protein [Methanobrevibacter sp.]
MKQIAKQIAQGRKWSTRDWPAYMGYQDALPMPDGCHVVDYETLSRLDRELWRYGLAIRSIDGEPLLYTTREEFAIDKFIDDGYLYLGLEKYIH